MNASIFRRKRRVGGKVRTSAYWSIKYKLDGDTDYRVRKLHVREKQVAQQLLAEFVGEKEKEACGILPPAAVRDGARKLLQEHLKDFAADLRIRGRAGMYVYNIEHHCQKLFEACGWRTVGDVTADSFVAWRQSQTKAAKTLNEYLGDARAFINWMKRQGRCPENPLAVVGVVDVRGKGVRKPRAMTDDEVNRLLGVAGERKLLYMLAVLTGLRRGELKALTWGDLKLDGVRPSLTVRASTSKNRRAATIWLRDDLAAELVRIRPVDVSDGVRLFRGLPKMEAFREDLTAAGVDVGKDSQGRKVMFHSFRHTLCTNLARAGVAPRVAMEMMRHSDMRLTNVTYTDAGLLPMVDALERLPRFAAVEVKAAAADCRNPIAERTQKGTQNAVRVGPSASSDVNMKSSCCDSESVENTGESHGKSVIVAASPDEKGNWGTRIRSNVKSSVAGSQTHIGTQIGTQRAIEVGVDLAEVVEAWPSLPANLRAAVLAIVRAGVGNSGSTWSKAYDSSSPAASRSRDVS